MLRRFIIAPLLSISMFVGGSAVAGEPELPADLILFNTTVWTADENVPGAEALAIRGSKIIAVGSNDEVLKLGGPDSRTLDLNGRMVVPGFIDGHTHFENATEWFFEARLMDVNSQELMLERLAEAAQRIPKGMWITGGDWGEIASREAQLAGRDDFVTFEPLLSAVDAVSPDHPVLFRRHDGDYFANSLALEYLRINKNTPNPGGGSYGRDAATGELNGMLFDRAGQRAFLALPPRNKARILIAARALMKNFSQFGITGIHDMTRVEDISQQLMLRTHAERSNSDLSIFTDLREENALTVRVYAQLALDVWADLSAHGISPGSGDDMIQFGALKSFIDGSLMFEPFNDTPNYAGNFTFRVQSPELTRSNFLGADRAGFDMATHQIGSKATALYLDWLEEAIRVNGPRDRRPRLIHMEYPRLSDIRRAGDLHAFADITPMHMLVEVDHLDEKLGPARAKFAFTGRTLIDNGIRINLVSDWPGGFYKIVAKPLDPLMIIYQAVVRRQPGEPLDRAWHPEEGITVEEGLRAYTINPAMASHQEDRVGSIAVGKLADIVVLSDNVLNGDPEKLLTTDVNMTIFGGNIIFERGAE
tara:strand:+ start:33643 stop:35415 length:1773 start_codon:yes stop_codon:yes gene_type:complete